jgi:hypothetical protein
LKQGRITHAAQDGSREFITLLACICGDGTALPPALIYKGEPGTIQDTWLEDVQKTDQVYFSTSTNGWSCDVLGSRWLVDVFDRHTKEKAGNRRRLLVVDGHSSHINMKFINLCDERRILLLVLPPHTTHRLQPLDVGCFSPLQRYYTNELNKLIGYSLGYNDMSKRFFWRLFSPAWTAAMSEQNIASAWAKTGLIPLNPDEVLSTIAKPAIPTQSPRLQTPMTGRAIRRFHKSYLRSPTIAKTKMLLNANERLAAEHSIATHVIRGLEQAIKLEKRKRRKGKKLNLLGEEASGPQFFSPSRVQAARDHQATKEAEKQQELDAKAEKKAKAEANKLQKEKEKAQRAIERAERQQLAAEEKTRKAAEKQALQELKIVVNATKSASRELKEKSILTKIPRKRKVFTVSPTINASPAKRQKMVVSTTTRGRTVLRPQRFDS